MAPKRPQEDDYADKASKRQRKGFQVGPANLPDGLHKRKVQKIKQDLIHKAKIKKEYAKIKAQEQPATTQRSVYDRENDEEEADGAPVEPVPVPTLEPHPDRLKLLERTSPDPEAASDQTKAFRERKRPRPQPFKHETEIARKRREETEARQKAREEAERERQRKIAERENFRKAMNKARRVGPDGKRKLGRESTVLLEKVKKMVGHT
jgi:hypothetical protein